ncbi:Glucan endo-1,3-beta-glucosidase 13 [Hibiscus syriacus]|uniref:glucan endo-1,3-beta-D-glucosidase n=1 Tax=Hibiscus syriacus TaxID=106335 RepID=A0A6A2Z844_HIBSY|nr:Glucan endo-1,3-beta-glucosidase 13 [Hibiscus syriacus]
MPIAMADFCRGSIVGVCYGRNADDLPTPDKVAQLVKLHNIKYLRIYDSNIQVLKAFANTGVELMVGVPNSDLLAFSQFQSNADSWLKNNIPPYYPATKISYITVGLEVTESPGNASALVVPAMHNVLTALKKSSSEVIDPNTGLLYTNMFDAQIDALYFAVMALNFKTIKVMIKETGWPSKECYRLGCGPGNVDCSAIQPSQPCFEPDNLVSHASFAFNSYCQQNGATDVACSFGRNGTKVDKDHSYDNCIYLTARGINKTAAGNTTGFANASRSAHAECSWIPGFFLMTLISFMFNRGNVFDASF